MGSGARKCKSGSCKLKFERKMLKWFINLKVKRMRVKVMQKSWKADSKDC
jgi:hypothetical protein